MFEITDDYFIAEDVLAEHLAQVVGIKRVYKSREVADLSERSQGTPCIHLIYHGDTLPDTSNGGALMQIKQTWLVVLASKTTQKNQGELLTNIIQALAGKTLETAQGSMGVWQRVNTPIKPSFNKGFSYYPLAFTCQMRMKTHKK